jgi:hypothetical protein
MSTKTIPLKDVRNALMCARVKQIARVDATGKPLGRVAAYTYFAPLTTVTCRSNWRDGPRRTFPDSHFGPLFNGDIDLVLARTRCLHGLAEVRRTWGAGMRALKIEFADGVMR